MGRKRIYSNNKEQKKAYKKRLIERNRLFIREYLQQHSCKDCNHNDWRVLEFDHLPEYKKYNDISELISLSTDRLKNEIAKCEVVCANCHNLRSYYRANTWRIQ